jgi:hypothetical protein
MSDRKPFLTAEWRWLAVLNYPVAPGVLEPFVPRGTVLDSFQGTAYVSMVGFLFLNTKVRGLSIPWHRNFEEVNLRFYVRRQAEDGWRRGVVFIKEIVPRLAIATVARLLYNENYVALPMWHKLDRSADRPRPPRPPTTEDAAGHRQAFEQDNRCGRGRSALRSSVAPELAEFAWWFGGQWCRLAVTAAGEPLWPAAGSLEEFITEHYWGYAAQRDGGCVEYRVEHPRWRVWRAGESVFECDADGLYGAQFAEALKVKPASAFLAEGSEVAVFQGKRT